MSDKPNESDEQWDGNCIECGEHIEYEPGLESSEPERCNDCDKDAELTSLRAEVDRLRGALGKTKPWIRASENGVHYCRWCDAGTHNGWHHSIACLWSIRSQEAALLVAEIDATLSPQKVGG